MNKKTRFAPLVESMEPRIALSTIRPTFTTHAYRTALAETRSALGTLAKTGNFHQARRELAHTAARIPYGTSRLLPVWNAKLATIGTPGSGLIARRQMLLDLNSHLHRGMKAGALSVSGPASEALSSPRLDSIARGLLFINDTDQQAIVTLTEGTRVLFATPVAGDAELVYDPPRSASSFPPRTLLVLGVTVEGAPPMRVEVELSGEAVILLREAEGYVLRVEAIGFPV